MEKLAALVVVLPAYNDEHTIGILIEKLSRLLPKFVKSFEIVVVDDASTDGTREVLEKQKKKIKNLTIISHKKNQGYGGALMHGFAVVKKEFIFYTDSDGQYDVDEITKLIDSMDSKTDMVTGFKVNRSDSWYRQFLGAVYNQVVRFLFDIQVKDIDCDFRLFRKTLLKGLSVKAKSGAFDLELMTRLSDRRARIKEVPVHHYPRRFGRSQVFTPLRVAKSIRDVVIFGLSYEKETNSIR